MSNKFQITNFKFQKQAKNWLKLMVVLGWLVVCPQLVFSAKVVPGVVPNPPPLYEVDPSVKPNLSGSIQNSGWAVLSGEEDGVGANDSSVGDETQEQNSKVYSGTNGAPLALPRDRSGIGWLVLLVILVASYFGYRRWRRAE